MKSFKVQKSSGAIIGRHRRNVVSATGKNLNVCVRDERFGNGPETVGSYGLLNNGLYDAPIDEYMQVSAAPLKSFKEYSNSNINSPTQYSKNFNSSSNQNFGKGRNIASGLMSQ